MRHSATHALYSYWNELRGNRLAPLRLEIEPHRIGELLLDAFILNQIDSQTFCFRLAGTRLSARFGSDLRGRNFLDRWRPQDRSLLQHYLADVADRGGAALFTAEGQPRVSRPVTYEILLLPLIHTGHAVDRFLGSVVPLEHETHGFQRLSSLALVAAESINPGEDPLRARGPALGADSSSPEPLQPNIRNSRLVRQGRRQFRVYDGGLS